MQKVSSKPLVPTARQIEINEIYHSCNCDVSSAAKKAGISQSAIRKNLFYGWRNGLQVVPDQYSPVAPAGWSSAFKTVQYSPKKGIIQVWDRLKPNGMDLNKLMNFLEDRTPVLKSKIIPPKDYKKDLMLEWKLFDQHHTLYSWGKQTGADYSIKHSQHLIEQASVKIFDEHGPVNTCVIVLGGDTMHMDNRSNATEKSGHTLNVDGMYREGLDTFILSMTFAIDCALGKARKVIVEVVSGNHDWHTSTAIAFILRAHYRNNPRVKIDCSAMEHKFFRWDTTFFMYSHGDSAPPDRYANFAQNFVIKNNLTGIKRIHVRVGHIHTKKKIKPLALHQQGICTVEYFDTLCAPDAYTTGAAFTGTRATTTDIFHKKWGKRGGMNLTAEELLENFTK